MYSIQQLEQAFELLNGSVIDNVPGCFSFDSNIPGKCVGITVVTHGNEPSGLAAFKYFLDNKIVPTSGRIIFVANNIKAAENYFSTDDEIEKENCRFVDINLNRLPKDCLEIESDDYEIGRVKELYPIYKTFDYGLDIHSTLTDPKPSIVNISDDLGHGLFAGFPDEIMDIIANMANVQSGIPACRLFGGTGSAVPILGVETGKHEDGSSYQTAVDCTLEFCRNCGVLPKSPQKRTKRKYQVLWVATSVFFENDSFETPKAFIAFEELTTETVLGVNDSGEKILSPIEGFALFGMRKGFKPQTSNDEVFFIIEKPYTIEI